MVDSPAEVIVVGAGFAGLAAAQVLGRAQRRVVVLGAGPTRNAEAAHAHNVLTRDGTPPAELLALARAEVSSLPMASLHDAHVQAIEAGPDGGLRVRTADAGFAPTEFVDAPHVLLATGARDTLPDVPGLSALWGRRAHSCPFCDGEAYAGRRVIGLYPQAVAAHGVSILSGWTDQLTVVDPADVVAVGEQGSEVTARLQDGTEVAGDGFFVGVTPVPRVDAVAALRLDRRGPFVSVDGNGRTSQPGLWAAGDCAWVEGASMPGGQVIAAMAAGSRAAIAIVFERLGLQMPPPPPVERAVALTGAMA